MAERITTYTVEQLDRRAEAFEALVVEGLRRTLRTAVDRAQRQGVVVAAVTPEPPPEEPPSVSTLDFLEFIRQLWQQFVGGELVPYLIELMTETGHDHLVDLTGAIGTIAFGEPLPQAFTDRMINQPLETDTFIRQSENRLVGIGDDLWEDARDEIAEGIQEGESIEQLADRVMEAADVTEPRARTIARTEANGAMNSTVDRANHRVADMFGIDDGIMKEWSATEDARTRPSHVAADGQVVGLDDPFIVGNASLAFPADPTGPPGEIINCRCTTLTVISDDVIALARDIPLPVTASAMVTDGEAFHLPGKHNQKKHANRFKDGVQVRGIDREGREITSSRDDSSVVILNDSHRVSDDEKPAVNADYAKLVEEYAEYLGDVPEEQIEALEDFISLEYRRTQRTLRAVNGDLSQLDPSKHQQIFDLQELIEKAGPSNTRYTFYRGIRNLDDVIGTNDPPIGMRFVDTGFASTSTETRIARAFTAHKSAMTPTIIEIDAPVGTTFLPVQAPLPPDERDLTGEMEALMPIGVEYEIIDHIPGDQFKAGTLKVRVVGPSSVLTAAMTPEELEDEYRHRLAKSDDETRGTPVFLVTRVPNDMDSLVASAYQEEDMPYDIVQGGGDCAESQWAVVKQGSGESVGCHDTEEAAQAQVAAIMAKESEDESAAPTGADGVTTSFDESPADHRYVPWSGVIALEGVPTGDGRQFEHGALTWADLPMPLGWMYERSHGGMPTDKVANVGTIDTITRGEGGMIVASGRIDLRAAKGYEVADMMGTREQPGSVAGISIDADDPDDPMGMNVEYVFPEGCGEDDAGTLLDDNDGPEDAKCMMPNLMKYSSGRIRAATLVDIPAFMEARIYLDQPFDPQDGVDAQLVDDDEEVILASAYTMTLHDVPPASWFEEPDIEPDIGAITVTDEGRFFGYLAPKHVAHRAVKNKRLEVPTRNVDYGIWMNRVTIADDGKGGFTRVATGPITMDCGHAPMSNRVTGAARTQHYDNSCSIVATARVGENSRGVWIAGAVLPDVTPDQIRRMMALQLSGDWGPHREKPGKRELVAALLVPVPGFPKRSYSTMSIKRGALQHVGVPLRFAVTESRDDTKVFNARAAADRIAASVGRDRASRARELAARVKGI